VLQGNGWTSGQYLYDGAGNVTQIGATAYQYDAVNRLVSWSSPGPTGGTISRSVTLDAYGNFLSMKVARCQTVGACFHSSSVAGQISGTTNHYVNVTYDAAANVTNDGRQFTYDTVGMMATSTIGGRSYRYLYTADDERIGIVEVTGTPVYTWTIRGFGNEILRNYRGTGAGMAWVEDEIWRGGSLLANERPSLTRHYALDHLGSPRALTGSTGTFLGTQDFQPYGAGGTTDGGALQFTGHERDAELLSDTTGSMPDYFHARNYDVARGRFLSVDPAMDLKKTIRNPQMWNRYSYVLNNPMRYTDPDGREHVQEPGFTKPLSEAGGWADQPSVSWAFYAQGALLSLVADEFVIGPAVGRVAGAIGRFLGFGSNLARGSVTLETAIAKGAVREGGVLNKIVGGIEAGFKSGAPKSADAALDLVAKAAVNAGQKPGQLVKATDGAQYVLQNVGDVKTFIYKTGEVIVKRGDEILVRYIPK
jgi:RHS repeat-associated protein